ncbi:MAG: hypothetical protein KJO09_00620 [Gammaproteobacteria bacterium]|nr:hypothetical protein [Gammaproteobacteria bacterium]
MASRPEVGRPVDVHGALTLGTPAGRDLNLTADGEHIRLKLSGWRDARELVSTLPQRRRNLRRLAKLLTTHGLTFSLESYGRPVFKLGSNISPNWLARLLGFAPAHIPFSAVRLLYRR